MKTPKLAITSQHNNRVDPAILTSSTRLFSDPCRFYPCANVFGITAATTSPFAQHTSSAKTFVCIFHFFGRSEEHTSELQSRGHLVCRLLLEKKKILY